MDYAPDGKTLQRFMESDAFFRGIRGPFGSGKTACCINELLRWGQMQEPDENGIRPTRFAAVRNTYGELQSTTVKSWLDWRPEEFGQLNRSSAPMVDRIRYRMLDRTVVDMEVWFVALDREEDTRKLLSAEFTGMWFEEAWQLHKGVIIRGKDRVGRYPNIKRVHPTRVGCIASTNSPDPDHWWAEWEMNGTPSWEVNGIPQGFEMFVQPGGRDPEAENMRWQIEGYYDQLVAGSTPEEIAVKVDNKFGYLRSGRPVYQDYSDILHCGNRTIEPDRDKPLLLGVDFGWMAACCIAQPAPGLSLDIIDEFETEDVNTEKFAECLADYLRTEYRGFNAYGWADPSGMNKSPIASEDQPNTHIEIMRAAGLNIHAAPSNDTKLRIGAVGRRLRTLEGGTPALRLSRKCVSLRKGFNGSYRFGRKTVDGDPASTAKPIKNEHSHVHDGLQYICLGHGGVHEAVTGQRHKPAPRRGHRRRYGDWARG